MSDSFTETTSTSWFQRIGDSFKGIVIGFILFIVAFPLLFWNEGRTIKQTKSLKETEAGLVIAKCDEVNPENEGKPVYMTGDAVTDEELSDDVFPVFVNGFKLKRNVEMYQWVEHVKTEKRKKLGGGEETVKTYTYNKEWSGHFIDSSKFEHPAEHENPTWDFVGGEVVAKTGTIGAFDLTDSIIAKMNWYESFKVVPPAPEKQSVQPTATPAPANAPEVQPTAEPALPEAQPTAEPALPEAQPTAEPALPEAQPTAEPALPEAQPIAEPALPEAQPTAEPALPEAQPTAEPALPEAQPTAEPALPEAQPTAEPEVPAVPSVPTVSETTSDEASTDATAAAPTADSAAAVTTTTAPDVQTPEADAAAKVVPEGYKYYNNGFYKGDPKKTAIGDVRVSFEYVPATEKISLVSGQQGNTFAPFQTKFNKIELVEKGVKSSEEMFKNAHKANSMFCWLLRLVGFLMMFFGLKKVFEPLQTIADVVPFIGTIIGIGTGIVAFLLAAGFSLLTIAIGWLFYRPLIGVPLLIAGLVFLLMPFFKGKKNAAAQQPGTPFEGQ